MYKTMVGMKNYEQLGTKSETRLCGDEGKTNINECCSHTRERNKLQPCQMLYTYKTTAGILGTSLFGCIMDVQAYLLYR